MKFLISVLLMASAALMLTGARAAKDEAAPLKIYFRKPASWSTAYLYYWNSSPGLQSNIWPGEPMRSETDGWMSFALSGQTAAHVIFSDRGETQTADLEVWRPASWYQEGEWWSFNPDRFQNFVFPNGGTKSLLLSFDDGNLQDVRLIELLNQYQLKGTFHLNSGLATRHEANHVSAENIATTYAGHEVSGHSATHPDLSHDDEPTLRTEVFEDRANLRSLSEQDVNGFAYPFGFFSDRLVELLGNWGFLYARVVPTTQDFRLPNDLLHWRASGYQTDAPTLGHEYVAENSAHLSTLMIWGHSWDLDTNNQPNNNWDSFEGFLKELSGRKEIWSTTMSSMARYLTAIEAAQVTPLDSTHFQIANTSDDSLWIRVEGGYSELPPHSFGLSVHPVQGFADRDGLIAVGARAVAPDAPDGTQVLERSIAKGLGRAR